MPEPVTNQQVQKTAIVASEYPEDRVGDIKTLYNVSAFQILWRNFLAGMSRAFGALFVYFFMLGLISYLFMQFIFPRISPLISQYTNLLQNGSEPAGSATSITQDQLNAIMHVVKQPNQ